MNDSEKRQVVRATGIVGGATFLSRILGFVRDMVIAAIFGAGLSSDAFFVAFRLPNLMRRLFAEGSLSIAFVPVFTEVLEADGREEAFRFGRASFRMLALILLAVAAAGVLLAPWIVRGIAPGFASSPEKLALTISLTRFMFPYVFFICLVALSMGMLNSLGHFAAPALAPVMLNVCMIGAVLVVGGRLGAAVYALALGVMLGGVCQLGMQIPALWKQGFRFRGHGPLGHPGVKRVGALMGPAVFGAAVYQISQLIGTLLASLLEEGSVSYLYYADRLVQFPLAIFGISAATAVLPTLSRQAASGDTVAIRETFSRALRWILFINLPAMVGLMVLSSPIVGLLFQRGAFEASMTTGTARALCFYASGLWAFASVRIAVSVFYAMQDTRTPVRIATISLLSTVVLSAVLMWPLSYGGLALATALGSVLNFGLLCTRLGKLVPDLFAGSLLRWAVTYLAMALVMGGLVAGWDHWLAGRLQDGGGGLFLRTGSGMVLGAVAYAGMGRLLNAPEMQFAVSFLKRRFA